MQKLTQKNKTPYWGQILSGLQFLCGGLEKSCSFILANCFTCPQYPDYIADQRAVLKRRPETTRETPSNNAIDNMSNITLRHGSGGSADKPISVGQREQFQLIAVPKKIVTNLYFPHRLPDLNLTAGRATWSTTGINMMGRPGNCHRSKRMMTRTLTITKSGRWVDILRFTFDVSHLEHL